MKKDVVKESESRRKILEKIMEGNKKKMTRDAYENLMLLGKYDELITIIIRLDEKQDVYVGDWKVSGLNSFLIKRLLCEFIDSNGNIFDDSRFSGEG